MATTFPSILDGTGRVTCGAYDGTGRWYSGSDTAGIHRSTDDDQGWEAFQAGLHLKGSSLTNIFQHCAGVGASADTVIHINGHAGSRGSLQTRLPGDTKWRVNQRYFGDGSNSTSGGGTARPTGRRVEISDEWAWVSCQDSSDGDKYGLTRSSDFGVTWSPWKFADNREYTGLFISPQFTTPGSKVLYVTADDAGSGAPGVYVITHADGTAVFTRIDNVGSGAPTLTSPRDLLVVNEGGSDVAYVAGSAGIHRCIIGDPTSGGWTAGSVSWSSITPTGTVGSDWNSVCGKRSGSSTYLMIGNFNAATNATGTYTQGDGVVDSGNGTGQYKATHMRSLNGGSTWTTISNAANVSDIVYGTAEVWVQATAKDIPLNASRLGGGSHSVGQLVLDPVNDVVRSFGKGGVWRTDDPWDATPHWQPFVQGLGGINVEAVVMDPFDNTHIANTDSDRHGYHFTNGGIGQPRCYFDSIPQSSFSVWYHPVATGNPDGTTLVGNGSNVSINTNPWNPNTDYVNHSVGSSVADLCRFGHGGSIITLILSGNNIKRSTAADLSGLTTVATGVGSPGAGGQSFCCLEGDPNVYLFTLTGWWRSTNAGASWTKVSTHSASGPNDAQAKCAQDPTNPTTLYYTLTEAHPGLWKVANANGAFTVSQVTGGVLSGSDICGPVAVEPNTGDVYVVLTADNPGGTDILSAPGGSTTFASIADANFAEYCDYPFNMSVVDERIVIGQSGHGLIMMTLTSGPVSPPVNTVLPVISGTVQEGFTLSTTTGSWTNSPTGYTYQWTRINGGSSDIPGATSNSYLLTSDDVEDTITVTVTATNDGGDESATSAPTEAVIEADAGPPPPPPPPPPVLTTGTVSVNRTLGCSQHVAYIQGKCNGARLCELQDISDLQYDRRLDDISEASVVIPISGDSDNPCCACLADVEPWCHTLTIVREGDGVVWTGPVVKVTYGYNSVKVEAKDILAWLQKRVNELPVVIPYPNTTVCLTTIAKRIIETAMAEDDSPCVLDCILDLGDGLPLGADRSRETFPAFGGPTAYDDLSAMGSGGVDYTVINQCILLTGEALPARAIGTLTDEMILGEIDVVKDGNLLANRIYVRYSGDDDCAGNCTPHSLPCPCPAVADAERHCYGLVEAVVSENVDVLGLTGAQVLAQTYLNSSKLVPKVVEFQSTTKLSPDCPWTINDLIPGQRLDLALTKLCIPVFQPFKIQLVQVSDGADGESISVGLQAQPTS